MSSLRRPQVLVALLAAIVLVTAAAPDASAWMPHARRYHVGRAITLDTNLLSRSGLSAWAIDEYLQARTPLPKLGGAFMDAERKYGVNARFLLAAAMHESGWGTSSISLYKHNLFGYNAYDRDPGRYATAFDSYAGGIDAVARFMKEAYLTPSGRWWGGQPTLRSMQRCWSSSGRWGVSVSRIANNLRLGSLRRRRIKIATPVVQGLVHAGDRATVRVSWKGGALPAAIGFEATWIPVSIDRELESDDAAPGAVERTAAPALPKAVTVRAREARAGKRDVTLTVAAPKAPGTYRLQVTMLDTGWRPLPATDRPSTPATTVRVWADRAVSLDLEPSADGRGLTLRVANTGTEPIPARPARAASTIKDPELATARSMLTLTATSGDPDRPAPVVLLDASLPEDMAPGATLVFHVRDIGAATGRTANWLSVDLHVLGDPSWLAPYARMGTWRTGSQLGSLAPEAPADLVATAGERSQWQASIHLAPQAPAPTGPPIPAPTAAPTAKPIAKPVAAPTPPPAVVPALAVLPTSEPVATRTPAVLPTPTPTAKPTAAPRTRSVTRIHTEDSRAIRYRGRWADASGGSYMGGGVTWSTTPGATATFTFTGRSVQWIGPVGPTRGRALVRIDGKAVATVSMWSGTFDARRLLFRRTFKASKRHTLSITVLSSPGHPYVAIDGFVIRT
jgi:hypothetical protein